MKNYRVYVIRKVYYPYGYETFYLVGKMTDAQKWCEDNRDASKEIYCNIEGSRVMKDYQIEDLKSATGNVIDRR